MNTFDDDNEAYPDEPQRRPPRGQARRPQRSATRPPSGSHHVLRLAGLVAVGIAIAFGLVHWVDSCSSQSKQQEYAAYFAAMNTLADDSASVGKKFGRALGTPAVTMDGFKADLARWSQQQQDDFLQAQRLRPPGPLQSAHDKALATFYLRQAALTNLANALTIAKEKHEGPGLAAAQLAAVARGLTTSDDVWDQLYNQAATQVLDAQNVVGVSVPDSRIVTNPDIVNALQLRTFYQRLGTGNTVTGNHGTRVAGANAIESGQSKPLSTSSTVTVFVGPNLVIEVLVQDNGESPEVQIPVTLTIKSGTKRLAPPQTKTISQIAAGAQATVQFTDIQVPPSAFSHNADIVVRVGSVPAEKILSDNSATYPVFFRLARS